MDTINWLHLRGLALLALLGLLFIYALVVAFCHDWRIRQRARRITEQHRALSVEPAAPSGWPFAPPNRTLGMTGPLRT
jgi:hypothetical protein